MIYGFPFGQEIVQSGGLAYDFGNFLHRFMACGKSGRLMLCSPLGQ